MRPPYQPPSDALNAIRQLLISQRANSLGPAGTLSSDEAAARRIVAAIGMTPDATELASSCAVACDLDLPTLAALLEAPSREALSLTQQRPMGAALVAAIAVQAGRIQQGNGDLPSAERCYGWASDAFDALSLPEGQSAALALLGRVLEMQNQLDEAEQCYQAALALDTALGDQINRGVDLGLLGQLAWLAGQLEDAERYAAQALELQNLHGDLGNAAPTFTTLAEVASARGQRWRAASYRARSWLARRRYARKASPAVPV
jgi:tetratricopeptide (TPR) repeat protein